MASVKTYHFEVVKNKRSFIIYIFLLRFLSCIILSTMNILYNDDKTNVFFFEYRPLEIILYFVYNTMLCVRVYYQLTSIKISQENIVNLVYSSYE